MALNNMSMAALGRSFTLGMLYDARRDELIPGFTLWDLKTIREHTDEIFQHSSAFEVSASDSTESKSSLLDIDASLEASFLCGMVKVGGSAKYLNDQKKFAKQSRVTFQYKATTHFKQLVLTNMGNLNERQIGEVKQLSATHVVVGILYGANAFFVFDSEKLDSRSVQNVRGNMHAVIKKIPSFNVDGRVEISLTDQEKAMTDKFSCKFHGDFILKSNPSTFEAAVKTYVELPKLLGEKGENSVPMKVWLMPLKKLNPSVSGVKSEVSDGLVKNVHDALERLRQMETRCNDCLADEVAEMFPQFGEAFRGLQNSCSRYRSNIQKIVKEKLPSIREGAEDESSLNQLFEDQDKLPFSHEELSKWLDRKEREVNVIRSCVEIMEGIKVVSSRSELDREVLDADVNHTLCFVFTSLEGPDPHRDAPSINTDSPNQRRVDEKPWCYNDDVVTEMREKAKAFRYIAALNQDRRKLRCLVAAVENEKFPGATIYQYKDIKLATENYPETIHHSQTVDRRDLLWWTCHLTVDMDIINKYRFLSEGNKKVTHGSGQGYPDKPMRVTEPQFLCREGLTECKYWEVEFGDSLRTRLDMTKNEVRKYSPKIADSLSKFLSMSLLFSFVWKPSGFLVDNSALSIYNISGDKLSIWFQWPLIPGPV
ncbi:cytolytic toxin-alpha-like [Cololabis saira]|uniref:cytolytic toxin-alpha-like n=1 Tax=Cololabis saira TaxID=129043 RepID=UPI002AD5405D|nr:cytolytic toxin-alpha-like [Cololabis saira]XP_061564594.1 cytolytic toxin-alpha-like [Cololabis saira]XP_061564595.1 cytolytic toxin-alpha-like [Cololabis saira]XP_061564596.1 cytolytic toxin-alpha-like [Cololabis saira]